MHSALLMMTALLTLTGPEGARAPATNPARISGCLVAPIGGREVEVPAEEPGKLVRLEAFVGMEVEIDGLLGKIDALQLEANLLERQSELGLAKVMAESDIDVRYATMAAAVAEAEYQAGLDGNKKHSGTYTTTEMRKRLLEAHRAKLQIEKAQVDSKGNQFTMGAKDARVKETQGMIAKSEIKSPRNGVVVELVKQQGEWVNPGDTVLKIVQMDKLWVKGFVNASDYSADEIANRPVTVQVKLARGRVEQFVGKIVAVDARVQDGNEYSVIAEVKNRQDRNQTTWLLRPGVEADMAIDVGGALAEQPMPPRR